MENIEVRFLGTSSAVPTAKRNHVGILISIGSEIILVDCGEGMQRQFRLAHISPTKISRIFITHWHGDHVLGLPGLLQTLAISQYGKTLKIYGPAGTRNHMQTIEQLMHGIKIDLQITELSDTVIGEKGFFIASQAMEHGIATNAYAFILPDKRRLDKKKLHKHKLPNSPILKDLQEGKDIIFKGKTIRARNVSYVEKGKKIAIIMDTSPNERAVTIGLDADLLICEAPFSSAENDLAREKQHLTAMQAATIAKKARAEKLILTHISERHEKKILVLEKEARKIFRKTTIAEDFDRVIV